MRHERPIAQTMRILSLIAMLAMGGTIAGRALVRGQEQDPDSAAIKEFMDRVQTYVRLHKSVEGDLPALKQTELPEVITAHQQALARKITEGRGQSREGDVFTPEATAAFRRIIRDAFQGPKAPNVKATVEQGSPLKQVRLQVNQVYPDEVPQTTVPPTLLLKLPKLPDEIEYRIVGHDLALLDVKANLVIDLIPDAIP